jgi:hypothetical protein
MQLIILRIILLVFYRLKYTYCSNSKIVFKYNNYFEAVIRKDVNNYYWWMIYFAMKYTSVYCYLLQIKFYVRIMFWFELSILW